MRLLRARVEACFIEFGLVELPAQLLLLDLCAGEVQPRLLAVKLKAESMTMSLDTCLDCDQALFHPADR
jgi:hypothetical protein